MQNQPAKELDTHRRQDSLDEIIENKFDKIVDIVNKRLEEVYQNLNLAMSGKDKEIDRELKKQELTLTNMVQVLYGIVNDDKVRLAALENVLEKYDIPPEEVQAEYEESIEKLKEEGGFHQVSLDEIMGKSEDPEGKSLITD